MKDFVFFYVNTVGILVNSTIPGQKGWCHSIGVIRCVIYAKN
jgi:hypothetical protein